MSRSPYARTRNKQLVRALRLIRLLQDGRWTLLELSRDLSMSTRTIRRDLAALQEAHLPVTRLTTDSGRRWFYPS